MHIGSHRYIMLLRQGMLIHQRPQGLCVPLSSSHMQRCNSMRSLCMDRLRVVLHCYVGMREEGMRRLFQLLVELRADPHAQAAYRVLIHHAAETGHVNPPAPERPPCAFIEQPHATV